jgi:hypothetical protein
MRWNTNESLLHYESLGKEHAGRILDVLLDSVQESDSLSAINETVVVGQADVHHLKQVSQEQFVALFSGRLTGRITASPLIATTSCRMPFMLKTAAWG